MARRTFTAVTAFDVQAITSSTQKGVSLTLIDICKGESRMLKTQVVFLESSHQAGTLPQILAY